jgi:hypothetical protein
MPASGTFFYAGFVPATGDPRDGGSWPLEDRSGAPRRLIGLRRLRDNRLVGLQPTARLTRDHMVIEATDRNRAEVRSAAFELDPHLIDVLRGGDLVAVVRTATADLGLSLLRHGDLIAAAGALTATPLGAAVRVADGPERHPLEAWSSSPDAWVDVTVADHTTRLRRGEAASIGGYVVSVIRPFEPGLPGSYESVAISRDGACPHPSAVRSAELLARRGGGLQLTLWT